MSPSPDGPFDDPQQVITDLRRQLAERTSERDDALAERDEGREQLTATAEVLGVINSSPGDLAPVFDSILEKALRLCEASFGSFHTFDGDAFRVEAQRGFPATLTRNMRSRRLRRPPEGSLLHRLVYGEDLVQVEDLSASTLPSSLGGRKALIEAGARTMLWIALRKDSVLFGAINIYRQEVSPFSDKQIALLRNFAAQAVIAMENARLLSELRSRTRDLQESLEYQTAISDVLSLISRSTFDLHPVLDTLVNTAGRLCNAHHGMLTLRDGEAYRVATTFAFSDEWDAFIRRQTFAAGRGSVIGRTLLEARVVQIADIAVDPEYQLPEAVTVGKFRTVLGVPLLREGEPVGVFAFGRDSVDPFTENQIELVRTFADQAVIAIENTRLITETREALEQQTATAEVLGVINRSPGDLAPVFDAILERALDLCEAKCGNITIYNGEVFNFVAAAGHPEFDEWVRQNGPARPGPGTTMARMIRGEQVVHIADIANDEVYRAGSPVRKALVEIGGFHTFLGVALRKDDALLGILHIYRQEVRLFSDKQIALLQNFAAQAVIAMENARLFGELRDRTDDLQQSLEYQTATSDVLKAISRSTFDLQPVLDTLMQTAARLCNAEAGHITRRDDDVYRVASTFALTPEWEALVRQIIMRPGDGTLVGRVASAGQVVQIDDFAAVPDHPTPEVATLGRLRTGLGVPLLRGGEPIGVISLCRQRVEPFTHRQIELVRTFADQAVIAMENVRLLGELRERTEEVAELNRGLEVRVAEQVEELGRVGRLKRFLAPQLAELIVSQGDEKILESHRREIVVVFCDLRGYTAFTETAEPEEVLDFLREYHGALGPLVSQFEGTLDQFSGDGIMVFFNDPVPIPDPAERAVKMAMAMREVANELMASWRRRRGRVLGFGVGIAQGYATLGQIGFAERSGYTAIGTVCNLAARLCAEAKDGQILVAQSVAVAVEDTTPLEEVGELNLKGLTHPVSAYNVPHTAGQPPLRVIEGGPQST